ncbi:MAG: ATP-binding protein [Candidatus Omnitrophica bacterium]|nr:ATP-binding protein [Candidatus Omnitrophota bacterium]
MNITLNPYSISGIILVVTCSILVLLIIIYGKTKAHRLWALFNVSVGIWGVGTILTGQAGTETIAFIGWRCGFAGVIFIPILFYHVVSSFCQLERRKVISFAYLQGFLFFFLNTTDSFVKDLRFIFDSIYYPIANQPFFVSFVIIWVILVLWGHIELFRFCKKAKGNKRNQGLYLFLAMAIGFSGGSMNFLPMFGIDLYPWGNFAISIYVAIATYAMLRHSLMDIEVIIKKTLVYSGLISIITIIYIIVIYLLERFFCIAIGYKSVTLTIAIIALFAIMFIPLKNKIQYALDKYFFKGTIDQIEREKELLGTELERSERLKSVAALAAGMAHEIKNPLTSIKTFIEYLDDKDNDPEFRKKFKSIVPKEIDKITSIINQLLGYSRAEKIKTEKRDMHLILDYVLDLYNSTLISKKIKLHKEYNSSNSVIMCDDNQIKQVFINIVLNCVEAMQKGGNLTVKTQDVNNELEISVHDDGAGIPKDKIKHIFDPFYTTKEKGTGLGLFVVHQIIDNNDGKIAIDSDLNRGTVVKVRFTLSSS